MVTLSPEDMKRHEAVMRMKLQEAEQLSKIKHVEKQKFFDKQDRGKIATPVIGKR